MGIFAGEDIIVFMCSVRFRLSGGRGVGIFFFGEGADGRGTRLECGPDYYSYILVG